MRRRLADEVHARPPAAVACPGVASCIALLRIDPHADDLAPLRTLAAHYGVPFTEPAHPHAVLHLPGLRVKWERHSEITSFVFVRALPAHSGASAMATALDALPAGWLASVPGQTIAAIDVNLLPIDAGTDTGTEAGTHESDPRAIAMLFDGDAGLIGSRVADGAAHVFTDFCATDDGRSRWLVLDNGMTAGQQARVTHRLFEIEIYRVLAMLAFPVARELSVALTDAEQRLSAIAARIAELGVQANSHGTERTATEREERALLDALTALAAEIEKGVAGAAFRFSAAQAYWDIVGNRIAELREARISGVPTIGEFVARRLAPAMNTVHVTARRQQELSARVARASNLLRTRVDIAREEHNQRLLAAMERRGKLSLRLQQTVEGLSVAAITYYAVGLLSYAVKPLRGVVEGFNPDWVIAAAIPVLALAVWRGVHRVRRELFGKEET